MLLKICKHEPNQNLNSVQFVNWNKSNISTADNILYSFHLAFYVFKSLHRACQFVVTVALILSVCSPQCCPNPRWATRLPLPVWSRPTAPQCHDPRWRSCGTWREITAPWARPWPHSSRRATGPPWSSVRWLSGQDCSKTCPSNAWCTTKASSHRLLYPWTLRVSWCQVDVRFMKPREPEYHQGYSKKAEGVLGF